MKVEIYETGRKTGKIVDGVDQITKDAHGNTLLYQGKGDEKILIGTIPNGFVVISRPDTENVKPKVFTNEEIEKEIERMKAEQMQSEINRLVKKQTEELMQCATMKSRELPWFKPGGTSYITSDDCDIYITTNNGTVPDCRHFTRLFDFIRFVSTGLGVSITVNHRR